MLEPVSPESESLMVSKRKSKFTDLLIRRGVIGPEQLAEATQMAQQADMKLADALTRLGYATGEEICQALAEEHGLDYVPLGEAIIPPQVIELVPESVARENAIIPLVEEDGELKVVVSDPDDLEAFDKLRFILNRRIQIALAPREAILEAINRHYGQTVGESADSMLQEFTDTAIDFTETEEDTRSSDEEVDENSAPIVGWSTSSSPKRCNCGRRTSISSPLSIASASGTASTGSWWSGTVPPKGCWVPSFRALRFSPNSTLPSGVAPRTAASRSRWVKRSWTCGSA